MPTESNGRTRSRIDDLEARALRIRAIANDDEIQVEGLRIQADGLVEAARELRELLGPENEPEGDAPAAHS